MVNSSTSIMVVLYATLAALHVSTALDVLSSTSLTTLQSSTLNGRDSSLALDDDPATCASTGFENSPWLKLDLGYTRKVYNVGVKGDTDYPLPSIGIRVGERSGDVGPRAEHAFNPLCARWHHSPSEVGSAQGQNFTCSQPLEGRYVSVETDITGQPTFLRLCHVVVYGTDV